MTESIAEQLAGLVTGDDVPRAAKTLTEKVKTHVIDTIGVAMAAASEPVVVSMNAAVDGLTGDDRSGLAMVWSEGRRRQTHLAALANGTSAHAQDFDDTHAGSVTHVSSVIVPTVLACGDAVNATGIQVIEAAVAGYETMIRLGRAAVGGYQEGGFHTTGVCGPFGAAAAAGRLLGLSKLEVANAFGIASSQASGLQEFLSDGSWTKRFHPGWAALGGIVAARMAKAGFRGPLSGIEGRFGLLYTHVRNGNWDIGAIVDELGQRWFTSEIAIKKYSTCHITHAFIDIAKELHGQLEWDEIADIRLLVAKGGVPIVCEPWQEKLHPRDAYDARFSLPVCVAVALIFGDDAEFDNETQLLSSDVLEMAGRCRYEVDPTGKYPGVFDGKMEVVLRDGRTFRRSAALEVGTNDTRVVEAVKRKFRRNAERSSQRSQLELLEDALWSLELATDVSRITAILGQP